MDERGIDRLARLAREMTPPEPEPELDAALEARLVADIVGGGARAREQRPRRRAAWAAFAAAAALSLVMAVVSLWPRTPLPWAVLGAAASDTGYVRAAGPDVSVSFADGTAIALAPGASMRVASVTSHGARLLLEDGRIDARFAKRGGAAWVVEAGPFAIAVTGTEFAVDWRAREERLELTLREGSVAVSGPAAEGVTIRAGQRLTADVRSGESHISMAADPPVSAVPAEANAEGRTPGAPTEDVPAAPPPADTAPSSSGPAAGTASSWAQRVAAGEFAAVVADAERQGVEGVLGGASLAELTALADSARYVGRSDLARRALLSTRSRFPSSPQATPAAFLLGRLADGGGSPGVAVEWYTAYLAAAPSGTFAAEALGRKMVALRRSSPAAAAALAEEYLRRYPRGAHASVARQLVGSGGDTPHPVP